MMVYQVWEIDPFTAIKNLWGTFLNEEKANLAAMNCWPRSNTVIFMFPRRKL
ncbi:MAG: hypothetical protein IJT54_05915 [Candidatus Methanomethylophilaceae archaeon]|nr:hypothetical protein [Candidatus Methanomethylophilaceae archaeon]